jgi:hypothetical protein
MLHVKQERKILRTQSTTNGHVASAKHLCWKPVLLAPSLGRKSIDRSFSETRSSFALRKTIYPFSQEKKLVEIQQFKRHNQHLSQSVISTSSHTPPHHNISRLLPLIHHHAFENLRIGHGVEAPAVLEALEAAVKALERTPGGFGRAEHLGRSSSRFWAGK